MSALSRSSILTELTTGGLRVSPILNDNQIGSSSIDLRIGTVVLLARAGRHSHVDPAAYLDRETYLRVEGQKQKHDRFVLPFHESFLLHPGSLALVPTLEWIKMPATLMGVVTARSSWAREGLNIATATLVGPLFLGIVTLELANFGEIPIKLSPGLRIAQIAFYDLKRSDPDLDDRTARKSQFDLKFEPQAGNVASEDECFIPTEDS